MNNNLSVESTLRKNGLQSPNVVQTFFEEAPAWGHDFSVNGVWGRLTCRIIDLIKAMIPEWSKTTSQSIKSSSSTDDLKNSGLRFKEQSDNTNIASNLTSSFVIENFSI